MRKRIYIIRHCEAEGQSLKAPLTVNGLNQAAELANFFRNRKVERIISSPFTRAVQSIRPLGQRANINVEIDDRLSERVLSSVDLPDWFEKLKETFTDLDLKFEGGESSRKAMKRITEVVEEIFQSDSDNTVIVSHGNIISLLLKKYNPDFHFENWKALSNPDVFQIDDRNGQIVWKRIWNVNTETGGAFR
ncbi:histidine phosphatase family protein [Virgibacillus sp. 179-BFC.A HS]|uniref:Histidine phosphatase family protein n=1 Tax=Tigheibacillus jepli TaxID=3035914 RepID=A0ABU5CKM0_9BACI|nr:histidine phosphatase family protein [Virgibacillus sp. 179-BFC.A HS]MDY0406775.1 histidine phosphatase family protein [Virgibacillus sp. 179-BFC.A HS]